MSRAITKRLNWVVRCAREGAKWQCYVAVNVSYFPCLFSRADIEHHGVQPESLSYHSKLKWPLFPKVKAAIQYLMQAQKLSLFLSGLSDRKTRKLSRARGVKRQSLRGAPMPEQRRVGQVVIYTKRDRSQDGNQALITTNVYTLNTGWNILIFFLLTQDWLFCMDVQRFKNIQVILASGWMHHLEFELGPEVLSQERGVLLHMHVLLYMLAESDLLRLSSDLAPPWTAWLFYQCLSALSST